MNERVLVTGGTGFLGSWAIKRLLDQGYRVRTTVRSARPVTDDRAEVAITDLTSPDGWAEAMAGCAYVIHPASPLGGGDAARQGVLNVLHAAAAAGVTRVVMTSAANTATPAAYTEEGVYDETLVTADDPSFGAYRRSKILAEKAAWDFMAGYHGPMTLTTVLPGAVFGPVLSSGNLGSLRIIAGLLDGAMPGVPRIGLEVVDVRDVIDLHLAAMTASAAAGERFLGTGEFMWMADVARTLKDGLNVEVPTAELPDDAVRKAAETDPGLQQILPALGRRSVHTTAKAERLLGWRPRPAAETVLDAARSILEWRA